MSAWTPRIRGPLILIRGRDTTVDLEVWGAIGVQEPSSGTITVYDASDTVIVNAQALSISSETGRAYTTIAAASLPSTLAFSESWRAEWSISLAGETIIVHQDAQLVRRPWLPAVTPADVIAACPQLANTYNLDDREDCSALATVIEAVAIDVQTMLCSEGRRPWLIFDAWKLNRFAVLTVLARLFRGLMFDQDASNTAALDTLATNYESEAASKWAAMSFKYDDAETGKGGDQAQKAGVASIRLGITR